VSRGIDYIGLGLIALGLGCMQVVMDRGEDDDWFGSTFIVIFASIAAIGLVGAVTWLLVARRPVVNLRVMADRNFAVGSLMIFMMGMVLYASAVVIPQLAQTVLGYTATLAGYILSPGALMLLVVIPIVGRVMPKVQTRIIVAFGFLCLGASLMYSNTLTPNVDFITLAKMRAAQTIGLAFLFVPISTIAYATLPKEQNGDAAALFTMFRNVGGSIGISTATSLVTTREQVRMAHLVTHLTPYDQPYVETVQRNAQTLMSLGRDAAMAHSSAVGMMFTTLKQQAAVLAYADVFQYCAALAFCIVPLAFLFSGTKAGGGRAPSH
jgi:DHA2 family multidrug resistance protein